MGNILVSLFDSFFTPLATLVWACFVLYTYKVCIVLKPWGSIANCEKAIERTKKRKEDEFASWRERLATDNEAILTKRSQIVALPLLKLREVLQSGEVTAVGALEAYAWKALEVNDRINCCVGIVREAFDLAEQLDREYADGSKEKPTLFGIPFSVKDNFFMEGYDCTIGLAKFIDQPKTADCSFVTHLRNLGAVPFVRTNVPQALLSFVCSNSVHGLTCNPHDVTRTPGGSSGGEAALLAAGGSPFGIGSDLAGSLRIPATMCGVVSLKPTQDRFVVTNTHGGVPGRGRLGLSFGFFTNTVEENVFLLKCVVGTSEYRKVTPLSVLSPLDDMKISNKTPLRIGYFDFDGFCPPVPSMKRVVVETVEKLKANNHTLIRFNVPQVDNMIDLTYKMIMPDGGAYVRSLYDADIVDPNLKQFAMLLKVPKFVRWLASIAAYRISPQLSAIAGAYVSDLESLRYTQELVDDYREEFIKYWKSLEIDALICPSFIVPAVPHAYPSRLSTAAAATALFNLVDFPAGVVPTGKVTHEDDVNLLDEKVFPVGYNLALKLQREACVTSVGLPTSVQVVALPFEEETCLRVMREVEELWKL